MVDYSDWVDLIGFIGGLAISSMLFPQVWKVYRTKSAQDLSWGFFAWYAVGQIMLTFFALVKGLWALYIPMIIENFVLLVQMIMKRHYDSRAVKSSQSKSHLCQAPLDNNVDSTNNV
mmetsp:Transcript_23962/g.32967  ORF Transcript_23962/g.32967 Transcript_23962/m.32967 type:complete len:117 (+) Transcript_23962:22-372(+)